MSQKIVTERIQINKIGQLEIIQLSVDLIIDKKFT